jgi:Na+/melibiose symporter-like transporter
MTSIAWTDIATTAMLVPIFAGYLSVRTSSRWGRRRPWMVIGTVFNVIGLGLLAFAGSPAMVVAAYVFVQASNNAASAAYAGAISGGVVLYYFNHAGHAVLGVPTGACGAAGLWCCFPRVGLASTRCSPNIAILAARDFCATG